MINLNTIVGHFLPGREVDDRKPISIFRAGYSCSDNVCLPIVEEWKVVGVGTEKIRGEEQRVYFLRVLSSSSIPAGFKSISDMAMLPNASTVGGCKDWRRMNLTSFFDTREEAEAASNNKVAEWNAERAKKESESFAKAKGIYDTGMHQLRLSDAAKAKYLKNPEHYRCTQYLNE